MSKETGGMAFPGFESAAGYGSSKPVTDVQGNVVFESYETGMTLRDWFAGQALVGEFASQSDNYNVYCQDVVDAVAKKVYNMADAMLKERSKS
jgi:hypothetical protein